MSLRNDAAELSRVLHQIVEGAIVSPSRHIADLAVSIAPGVLEYDRAVFDLRSRESASDALDSIVDNMNALSAAVTRGELPLFGDKVLGAYWRLYTIFRESKYRDQTL
jgi:hypothetical protein